MCADNNMSEDMTHQDDDSPSSLGQAKPLFLLGCPRSGTTLLCRILNAHPAILMTNETAVFIQLNDMVTKSRRGCKAGILFGKQYHELWADHLGGQAKDLVESYYGRIAAAESKTCLAYWGEKHPHNSDCLDFLRTGWPEARYLYLVRDPRDSALSIAAMTDKPYQHSLKNWKLFSDKYEAYVDALGGDRCLTVRYEDLVADYPAVAEQCIQWLGLEVDEAVTAYLERYKDVDAHAVGPLLKNNGASPGLAEKAKAKVKTIKKTDYLSRSVSRWRETLAPEDIAFSRECVGAFLARYGYDTDDADDQPDGGFVRRLFSGKDK